MNYDHQRSESVSSESSLSRIQSTAQKMMQQQGRGLEQLYLLRGPILIGVAVLSVVLSIAQSLSFLAMLQLTLLGAGLAVLSYDVALIGHDQLRLFLNQQLESIVWDDVLYQFWHPDIEWWRVFVDTIVGHASWMYILPSTSRQRAQLVQAALRVDEQEAQRILFAPGGYKNLLLPRAIVKWLEESNEDGNNNPLEIEVVSNGIEDEDGGVSSSSSSESSSPPAEKESLSEPPVMVEHEDAIGVTAADNRNNKRQPQPSLSDTMKSIVRDALSDQLKEVLTYVPESKHLLGVGVTAAAALALHLRYSSRARRIAVGVLETSTMAGLSTVSLGATALCLAKMFGPGGTFSINESNVVAYISNVFKLKKSLSGLVTTTTSAAGGSNGNNQYKKGIVCAAVALMLLRLRKRHQRRQQPTSSRSTVDR